MELLAWSNEPSFGNVLVSHFNTTALCLTPFVIWLAHMFSKRKHAAKDMKRTRFDIGNGRLVTFHTFGNMISWLPQHKPKCLHNRFLLTYLTYWSRLFIKRHCFSFVVLACSRTCLLSNKIIIVFFRHYGESSYGQS